VQSFILFILICIFFLHSLISSFASLPLSSLSSVAFSPSFFPFSPILVRLELFSCYTVLLAILLFALANVCIFYKNNYFNSIVLIFHMIRCGDLQHGVRVTPGVCKGISGGMRKHLMGYVQLKKTSYIILDVIYLIYF
jgi:hypothetical protein